MPATVVLWGAFCVVGLFVRKTGRFTDKCQQLVQFIRKKPSFTDKLIPNTIPSPPIASFPSHGLGFTDLISLTAATRPKFCPVRRVCCGYIKT